MTSPYEIEFSVPASARCNCCKGLTTRLTRFVYRDDDAFGIYYAAFSNSHPDHQVDMLVSLGDWGEDSTPSDRAAFYCDVLLSEGSYQVMLRDAATSPWGDAEIVGLKLSREDALSHPLKQLVFEVLDEAFLRDPSLKGYRQRVECGDPAAPLEHNFGMPDEIFALGDDREHRATLDNRFAALDGKRFFVRCLLPIPVEHYGTWTLGVWIELSRNDFDTVLASWDKPDEWALLQCTGTLANSGASLDLPIPLGSLVSVHGPNPDHPPYVGSSSDAQLSKLLSQTWPRESFEDYAINRGML